MSALAEAVSGTGPPLLKAFRGGTHRSIAPSETLARVRPLFGLMGITRIADITGLDRIGLPVVFVCRPNSRSLSVAQGKGADMAAAEASGVMESVESWHAERLTLPLKLGSYNDIRDNHPVVDITGLPKVAGSAFHPDLPLLWIEGLELLTLEPIWIPYELVHTNYTLPLPSGSGCFLASSNGLASGNHLLEAVSHAICEVVERDASTLWQGLGEEARVQSRLDLATVDDPLCRQVLERYRSAEVAVATWETTSDVGIPAFTCIIAEAAENPFQLLHSAEGMGCHPVREVALLRALTEAAQSRLTIIAGSREDVAGEYDRIRNQDVQRAERALVGDSRSPRPFGASPSLDSESFDADLAWMFDRLRAVGVRQVVAVDLTRPELGIPVVRVVIPGLESSAHLPGYAPGARAQVQ